MIPDCWLQWLQTNGTWADWVLVIATGFLVIVAFGAVVVAHSQLKSLRQSVDIQLFSRLLEEIAKLEASHDRGLVRKEVKPNTPVAWIKRHVKMGRKLSEEIRRADMEKQEPRQITTVALIGNAIERTIERYDRVAFLILGNGSKLRMDVPLWVWGDINMIRSRLHNWVVYRQTTDVKEYSNQDYAIYFERLWAIGRSQGLFRE